MQGCSADSAKGRTLDPPLPIWVVCLLPVGLYSDSHTRYRLNRILHTLQLQVKKKRPARLGIHRIYFFIGPLQIHVERDLNVQIWLHTE